MYLIVREIVKEIYFLSYASGMLSWFENCIPQQTIKQNVPERIGDKDNGVHRVFKWTDPQYIVGFGGEGEGIIVNRSNVMKW